MKIRFSTPFFIAGFIALISVSLFLHTASRRHDAAEQQRHAAAAGWLKNRSFPDPRTNQNPTLRRVLPSGPARDVTIQKRLLSALDSNGPLDRTRAVLALLKEFTSDDFRVALNSIPIGIGGKRNIIFKQIFEEWLARDPKAATEFAANDGKMDDVAGPLLVGSDLESAMAWANGDPMGRRMDLVIGLLAEKDPDLALEMMSNLPGDRWKGPLAGIMRNGGREKVLAWLELQDDPAIQIPAASIIFNNWATHDSMEERFALLKKYPRAFDGVDQLAGIIHDWNETDPAAARSALQEIPAGPERLHAVEYLFLDALANDDDTADMIRRFPEDLNDPTLAKSIPYFVVMDGPLALERLKLISDPALREKATLASLATFIERHPDEASQWLEHQDISPAIRQQAKAMAEEQRKESPYDPAQIEAISR